MNYNQIIEVIRNQSVRLREFETGDLSGIADIKDHYINLKQEIANHDALKDVSKFVNLLVRLTPSLSAIDIESKVKDILLRSNQVLDDLFSKTKSGQQVASEMNQLIKEAYPILKGTSEDSSQSAETSSKKDEEKQQENNVSNEIYCENCKDLIEGVSAIAGEYESGDLMSIVELKNVYQQLAQLLRENNISQEVIDWIHLLVKATDQLSEPVIEDDILEFIKNANQEMKNITTNPQDLHPEEWISRFEEILEKKDESIPESEKASTVRKYTDNYFDGIVSDKKMLSQLADEIREHLDNAQYTLVELEHDVTNQDNINKVFRSFHTIKGSSAFLGLKNIEEVGHEMESLLVLVRDGKLRITKELIDVIFFGIELLRELVSIMEAHQFDKEKMAKSFVKVDIFPYIELIRKILDQYQLKRVGEILAEEGKLSEIDIESILSKQKESDKKFGAIAIEEKMVSTEDVKEAIKKQTAGLKKVSYVKVSNERLNSLIDIVGELVINQSMLREMIEKAQGGDEESTDDAERVITQLESITTNIKNLVLSMGMVPIAEVFNKLRVVIRNTSSELGKAVAVEIHGEETELDRNVVEAIYDPLVHMVRNALDHGLENPEERENAGKDRVGKISIVAEHKGNGIQIIVSDDGKGIDKQSIIKKALERGLIDEDKIDNLDDKEIYNLLFMPGFSTAKRVTEVSGRGVGLDVVKKNIDDIHGKVEVISEYGNGTQFIIRLPLTLAIIEGFVVEISQNKYVLPFSSIDEIIVPEKDQLSLLDDGSMMLFNRGKYVPLISSSEIFLVNKDINIEVGNSGEVELVSQEANEEQQETLTTEEAEATPEVAENEVKETEKTTSQQTKSLTKSEKVAVIKDITEGNSEDRMLVIIISHENRSYGIQVDRIIGKQEIVVKNLGESMSHISIFSGGTIFGDGTIGFVVDIEGFLDSAKSVVKQSQINASA